MPDRLQELLRQRALIQDHLAWLDREIASAQGKTPSASITPAVPQTPPSPQPTGGTAASSVDDTAAEIISSYEQPAGSIQTDIRRGCFLYFFGAFAALVAGLLIWYFIYKQQHPDQPSPPAAEATP